MFCKSTHITLWHTLTHTVLPWVLVAVLAAIVIWLWYDKRRRLEASVVSDALGGNQTGNDDVL